MSMVENICFTKKNCKIANHKSTILQ